MVVVSIIAGAGYYSYASSLQPNIQATNLQIGTSITNPQTVTVQDQGRVSVSGSISLTASANAVYTLVFDNTFSTFSTKQVSLSYTVAGSSNSKQLTIPAGEISNIQVSMNSGQTLTGTFSISGGSSNDVDFSITQYTCSQSVPFSFVLVNSGSANGYAVVSLHTGNGSQIYSNKYYVQMGQQIQENGTANIADCASHTISSAVSEQQKA